MQNRKFYEEDIFIYLSFSKGTGLHDDRTLSYSRKESGSNHIFLYIFMHEARLSGVRAYCAHSKILQNVMTSHSIQILF